VKVSILGPLQMCDEGGLPVAVTGPKQRALLTLLAARAGETVATDQLVDVLYGDDLPANTANALQTRVSQLRKVVGRDRLVARGPGYALAIEPDAVDAHRFERLAAEGHVLTTGRPQEALTVLDEALRLWRGPALVDLPDHDGSRTEASRLGELRLNALEDRATAQLALGRAAEAVSDLQGLVQEHPLRESLRGQLMVALYRTGRQAEALRTYDDARRCLRDELGLDPGPELRRIEDAVLNHDPSLDGTAGQPVGHLPGSLTSFVGRQRELADVCELIDRARLLTLTGPGGAGKTRLALEAGAAVQSRFRDGVWFVELAPLPTGDRVLGAVAATLGVRSPEAMTAGRIGEFLAGKELLLVLDNCEHVVDAVASVVEPLLGAGARLRILTTSREPLGVLGEMQWPVPPLALPPVDAVALDDIVAAESVQLFVERARAVRPDFELSGEAGPAVAEICRQLDGIPLAVELAAVRVKALPVGQIAERLDDRFRLLSGGSKTALPRHQTLRALVDWSYELLFDEERALFDQLSVFPAGCSLEAAEAMAEGVGLDRRDTVDILGHLVDKSLVLADHSGGRGRYRLLVTLRHYGLERLVDSGADEAARRRQARWVTELAGAAEPRLGGRAQGEWLSRLTVEHENLRAVLDWVIARGDAELALHLGADLAWFWWNRGHQREGRGWLERALALPGSTKVGPDLRARALGWACHLAADHDLAQAIAWGEAAVAEPVVESARRALAQLQLAAVLIRSGDDDRVAGLVDDALLALRASGDDWGVAWAHNVACFAALGRGDLEAAESACRESLARFRAVANSWGQGRMIHKLGFVAELSHDYGRAAACYEESIVLARRLGLDDVIVFMLGQLGRVLALAGDPMAEPVQAEADSMMRWLAAADGPSGRRRSDLARAQGLYEDILGWYRVARRHDGEAFALRALGLIAEMRADRSQAERLFLEALDAAAQVDDGAEARQAPAGWQAAASDPPADQVILAPTQDIPGSEEALGGRPARTRPVGAG
jgi:predicted ATPase/DNA-binding SARP family transcriptional activator